MKIFFRLPIRRFLFAGLPDIGNGDFPA